jgi:DNA-binding NarL/FixJ family response regulator
MNGRTVLLYGRSLLLSGVAASLEQCPDLRVVHAATWEEVCRLPAEYAPDAVIFDLSDAQESHLLPLWFKNPALLMLGLNPECNQAVLLTGQETRSLTMSHVKEMIGVANQVVPEEGPCLDHG